MCRLECVRCCAQAGPVGRASSGGGSAGAFSAGLARAPRLEIKKDPKGMVTVPGATTIEAGLRNNPHTLHPDGVICEVECGAFAQLFRVK